MPKDYVLELTKARVFRADNRWETSIGTKGGFTVPFVVERIWSGPAGHYVEQWELRRGDTIIYRSSPRQIRVWGMQSTTGFEDVVTDPVSADPGSYTLAFFVEGRHMADAPIEIVEEAAA